MVSCAWFRKWSVPSSPSTSESPESEPGPSWWDSLPRAAFSGSLVVTVVVLLGLLCLWCVDLDLGLGLVVVMVVSAEVCV